MTIDDRLKQPIPTLPEHPYVASLRSFGADEVLAGFVDAGATTLANSILEESSRKLVLPFVGPVIEKLGFFPLHLRKAWKEYQNTPESERKEFGFYFRGAIQDGFSNLAKDLFLHDPLYIGFMSLGLSQSEVHPAALSAASYVTAILLVAGIDVAKDEGLYLLRKRKLKQLGFETESYYEARFYMRSDMPHENVLSRMCQEFKLGDCANSRYHDRYFGHTLPQYGGRKAKLRIRNRERFLVEDPVNVRHVNTVQIVYSRAKEARNRKLDQHRYFPTQKDKIYCNLGEGGLGEEVSNTMEGLADANLRNHMLRIADNTVPVQDIMFERTICRSPQLAVCVDHVKEGRGFYLVELKAYKGHEDALRESMRFLMTEFPAIQTTIPKCELMK